MRYKYLTIIVFFLLTPQNLYSQKIKVNWSQKIRGSFRFALKDKTLRGEASAYEYFKCEKIIVTRKGNIIHFETVPNASTHSVLIFTLKGDYIIDPKIEVNSIVLGNKKTFLVKKGFFEIDERAFKKNIIKANFNFDFGTFEKNNKKMLTKIKL